MADGDERKRGSREADEKKNSRKDRTPSNAQRSKDGRSSDSKSRSSGSGKESKDSDRSTKTEEEVQTAEWDKLVTDSIASHGGYVSQPILRLSDKFSLSPLPVFAAFLLVFLFVHGQIPIFTVPLLSASVTFIIPMQNTINTLTDRLHREKKGIEREAAQWIWFWIWFVIAGGLVGWVGIYRPGWKGWMELYRTASLILVGGPWFSPAVMRPTGPSKEPLDAERQGVEREQEKRKQRRPPEQVSKGSKDGRTK